MKLMMVPWWIYDKFATDGKINNLTKPNKIVNKLSKLELCELLSVSLLTTANDYVDINAFINSSSKKSDANAIVKAADEAELHFPNVASKLKNKLGYRSGGDKVKESSRSISERSGIEIKRLNDGETVICILYKDALLSPARDVFYKELAEKLSDEIGYTMTVQCLSLKAMNNVHGY